MEPRLEDEVSAFDLSGRAGKGNFTADKSLEREACRKLALTGELMWFIPSSAGSVVPVPQLSLV